MSFTQKLGNILSILSTALSCILIIRNIRNKKVAI